MKIIVHVYNNSGLILFTIVRFQYITTLCVLWSHNYHKISSVYALLGRKATFTHSSV